MENLEVLEAWLFRYDVLLYVCGFLLCLFYCFVVWLILAKSKKEMATYRWILLNNVSATFLFSSTFVVWQFFPLMPMLGGLTTGPVRGRSECVGVVMMSLCTVFNVNLLFSYATGLMYQFSLVSSNYQPFWIFGDRTRCVLSYVSLSCMCDSILITLIFTASMDPDTLVGTMAAIEVDQAVMLLITQRKTDLVGFTRQASTTILVFIALFAVLVSVFCACLLVLHVSILRLVHKLSKGVSAKTRQMHLMMLRHFFAQSTLIAAFILLPFLSFIIALFFAVRSLVFGALVYLVMLLYAPVSYSVMLVFIKPYRSFLSSKLHAIKGTSIIENSIVFGSLS